MRPGPRHSSAAIRKAQDTRPRMLIHANRSVQWLNQPQIRCASRKCCCLYGLDSNTVSRDTPNAPFSQTPATPDSAHDRNLCKYLNRKNDPVCGCIRRGHEKIKGCAHKVPKNTGFLRFSSLFGVLDDLLMDIQRTAVDGWPCPKLHPCVGETDA